LDLGLELLDNHLIEQQQLIGAQDHLQGQEECQVALLALEQCDLVSLVQVEDIQEFVLRQETAECQLLTQLEILLLASVQLSNQATQIVQHQAYDHLLEIRVCLLLPEAASSVPQNHNKIQIKSGHHLELKACQGITLHLKHKQLL